jgi:hypothetical protein
MKNLNPKSIMLLAAASSLFFAGCQKEIDTNTPQAGGTQSITETAIHDNGAAAGKPQQVVFDEHYDFSTFPLPAPGTFTAKGALTISGTCQYFFGTSSHIDPATGSFIEAHNKFTLTATDGSGTITFVDECNFSINQANPLGKGQWQIVSGTGAYANIHGNGEESFSVGLTEEVLTGIIY